MRDVRNELIKMALLEGRMICYRSSGNSLKPRVCSGDQCCFVPVTHDAEVKVNDIVFCEVQPGDRFYVQKVKQKFWDGRDGKILLYNSQHEGLHKRLDQHGQDLRKTDL